MSMFSDMLFEEYEMLDEGERAEKYLSDKREKKEKDRENDEKYRDYSRIGSRMERSSEYVKRNPTYDKGKSISNLRQRYYDVMPNKRSKSEEKYEKAIKTAEEQDQKAREMANNAVGSDDKSRKSAKWGAAFDGARRHLRRHPKTESAIMLIEAYECDYIY